MFWTVPGPWEGIWTVNPFKCHSVFKASHSKQRSCNTKGNGGTLARPGKVLSTSTCVTCCAVLLKPSFGAYRDPLMCLHE